MISKYTQNNFCKNESVFEKHFCQSLKLFLFCYSGYNFVVTYLSNIHNDSILTRKTLFLFALEGGRTKPYELGILSKR